MRYRWLGLSGLPVFELDFPYDMLRAQLQAGSYKLTDNHREFRAPGGKAPRSDRS